MPKNHQTTELARLIAKCLDQHGVKKTLPQGLGLLRANHPTQIESYLYKPAIILVAQGRKQTYLSGIEYTYDPQHYLIVSVPLPVHSHIRVATPESPFLSMSITINPAELSALILEMSDEPAVPAALESGISVSPAPEVFYDAAIRLLRAVQRPMDARILAPLCIRELLYHALQGPQGDFLRAIALRQGHWHRIAHVMNLIHTNVGEPLDVPALAQAAGMSVSTFHHNFKKVTSVPPLQYIKSIRLHNAKSLMLYEGATASEAAYRVGYASPSQFSREFRRQFGLPPGEEIARMKAAGEEMGMAAV